MMNNIEELIEHKVKVWNSLTNQCISSSDWLDWKWQFRNRIQNAEMLVNLLNLDAQTKNEIITVGKKFLISTTPFQIIRIYDLITSQRNKDASELKKVFLPSIYELNTPSEGIIDGLGEDGTSVYPFISQLYPDRVLLFVTDVCPLYCRYCFRRRKVIHEKPVISRPQSIIDEENLAKAIKYITSNPSIRDVILSGGEPLILSDKHLEKIISELRKVKHVDIIRIDTKMPTVIPQRITDSLINMLRKYHPIFMTLHFVHPAEIDEEVKIAVTKLADAGIPLGTYTPVLRGINNDRETLKILFWELVKMRIRPYYLVHFVPTIWTEHFRVPLRETLNLIAGMQYELSGIALPQLKVYVPKLGKVPLVPQKIEGPIVKGNKNIYKFIIPTPDGEKIIYYEEPKM